MNKNFVKLALECGVKFIRCDRSFGGPIGYIVDDSYSVCGFSSELVASKHWFKETFGVKLGPILKKLLTKYQ